MEIKNVAKAICVLAGALGAAFFAGYKTGEKYGTILTLGKVEFSVIEGMAKKDENEKKEENKEQKEA